VETLKVFTSIVLANVAGKGVSGSKSKALGLLPAFLLSHLGKNNSGEKRVSFEGEINCAESLSGQFNSIYSSTMDKYIEDSEEGYLHGFFFESDPTWTEIAMQFGNLYSPKVSKIVRQVGPAVQSLDLTVDGSVKSATKIAEFVASGGLRSDDVQGAVQEISSWADLFFAHARKFVLRLFGSLSLSERAYDLLLSYLKDAFPYLFEDSTSADAVYDLLENQYIRGVIIFFLRTFSVDLARWIFSRVVRFFGKVISASGSSSRQRNRRYHYFRSFFVWSSDGLAGRMWDAVCDGWCLKPLLCLWRPKVLTSILSFPLSREVIGFLCARFVSYFSAVGRGSSNGRVVVNINNGRSGRLDAFHHEDTQDNFSRNLSDVFNLGTSVYGMLSTVCGSHTIGERHLWPFTNVFNLPSWKHYCCVIIACLDSMVTHTCGELLVMGYDWYYSYRANASWYSLRRARWLKQHDRITRYPIVRYFNSAVVVDARSSVALVSYRLAAWMLFGQRSSKQMVPIALRKNNKKINWAVSPACSDSSDDSDVDDDMFEDLNRRLRHTNIAGRQSGKNSTSNRVQGMSNSNPSGALPDNEYRDTTLFGVASMLRSVNNITDQSVNVFDAVRDAFDKNAGADNNALSESSLSSQAASIVNNNTPVYGQSILRNGIVTGWTQFGVSALSDGETLGNLMTYSEYLTSKRAVAGANPKGTAANNSISGDISAVDVDASRVPPDFVSFDSYGNLSTIHESLENLGWELPNMSPHSNDGFDLAEFGFSDHKGNIDFDSDDSDAKLSESNTVTTSGSVSRTRANIVDNWKSSSASRLSARGKVSKRVKQRGKGTTSSRSGKRSSPARDLPRKRQGRNGHSVSKKQIDDVSPSADINPFDIINADFIRQPDDDYNPPSSGALDHSFLGDPEAVWDRSNGLVQNASSSSFGSERIGNNNNNQNSYNAVSHDFGHGEVEDDSRQVTNPLSALRGAQVQITNLRENVRENNLRRESGRTRILRRTSNRDPVGCDTDSLESDSSVICSRQRGLPLIVASNDNGTNVMSTIPVTGVTNTYTANLGALRSDDPCRPVTMWNIQDVDSLPVEMSPFRLHFQTLEFEDFLKKSKEYTLEIISNLLSKATHIVVTTVSRGSWIVSGYSSTPLEDGDEYTFTLKDFGDVHAEVLTLGIKPLSGYASAERIVEPSAFIEDPRLDRGAYLAGALNGVVFTKYNYHTHTVGHSTARTNWRFVCFLETAFPSAAVEANKYFKVSPTPSRERLAALRYQVRDVTPFSEDELTFCIRFAQDQLGFPRGWTYRPLLVKDLTIDMLTRASQRAFPGVVERVCFHYKNKEEAFPEARLEAALRQNRILSEGTVSHHIWGMIPVPKFAKRDDTSPMCRSAVCPALWYNLLRMCYLQPVVDFVEEAEHGCSPNWNHFASFNKRIRRLTQTSSGRRQIFYFDFKDHGPSLQAMIFEFMKEFFASLLEDEVKFEATQVLRALLWDDVNANILLSSAARGQLVTTRSGMKDGGVHNHFMGTLATLLFYGRLIWTQSRQLGFDPVQVAADCRLEVHSDDNAGSISPAYSGIFSSVRLASTAESLGMCIKEGGLVSDVSDIEVMGFSPFFDVRRNMYFPRRGPAKALRTLCYYSKSKLTKQCEALGDLELNAYWRGVLISVYLTDYWNVQTRSVIEHYWSLYMTAGDVMYSPKWDQDPVLSLEGMRTLPEYSHVQSLYRIPNSKQVVESVMSSSIDFSLNGLLSLDLLQLDWTVKL
jgi:hypothetical protein